MSQIINIKAREILDSRGNPTVETDVYLETGVMGRFSVPSGASTGEREVLEMRDGDKSRYLSKGVLKAVDNVNKEIRDLLLGMDSFEQREIDELLINTDGTENMNRLGANAILGVSVACAKASANELEMPLYRYLGGVNAHILPVPMTNVINGGEHADNNLDIQEFMLMPLKVNTFKEAVRVLSEIFHTLKKILNEKKLATGVGDEGRFAPMLKNNEEALNLLMLATEKAGYKPGEDIYFALDAAASSFYENGKYRFENNIVENDYLIDKYAKWVEKYPIISIEDGLAENDWSGWKKMNDKLGNKIQIVGDDIFVTNVKLLKRGIEENVANSILIKLNQIGTMTQTIEAIELARKNNWTAVISHRSGETEDSTIADLAVALNTGFIKTGSVSRSERTAKYNQLMRIEEELLTSIYGGMNSFYNLK